MGSKNIYNNSNRWGIPGIESLSTRREWKDSDFAKEFEKIVLDSVEKFELFALKQKKASGLSDLANESEATKKSIEQTTNSVVKLDSALNNINTAEDEVVEEEKEISSEEHKKATLELIAELRKKAYIAADSGDTILAYKIERAIEEIEGI